MRKLLLFLALMVSTVQAESDPARRAIAFKRTLWVAVDQELKDGILVSEVRQDGVLRVLASEWSGRQVGGTKRLLKDDFDFFVKEFEKVLKPFATREPPRGCLRPILVSVEKSHFEKRDTYGCLDGRLATYGPRITALLRQLKD